MEQVFVIPERVEKMLVHFTGRAWLLKKIDSWLKDENGERMFLLSGKPGTGKSMISACLCSDPRKLKFTGKYGGSLKSIQKKMRAAYFCISRNNVSPREFALSVSKNLLVTLPGFSDALASTMPDKNIPTTTIKTGKVIDSAIVGQWFENFNAGDLDDEPSYDRLVGSPLKYLYQSGCKEPALVIVDGLDEAMTYTGRTNIILMLKKLLEISPLVRLFATTRPDPDVLERFPLIKPFDLTGPESDEQADLTSYVRNCLKNAGAEDLEGLAEKIITTVNGNFLFANLLLEDLLPRINNVRDVDQIRLPRSLDDLYMQFLDREVVDEKDFLKEDKPVLAMIAIGQGPGLTSTLIEKFTAVKAEGALRKYKQYLDGDIPEGPFRPFHKSLTDFFLDEGNHTRFKVDPGDSHLKIVDHYCAEADCRKRYPGWDEYAVNYVFGHFADAVRCGQDSDQRQRLAQRLVDLLGDAAFAKAYESRLKDISITNMRRVKEGKPVLYQVPPFIEAWQNNLQMALRAVTQNDHPDSAFLVVDVGLRLSAFRHELLRTDQLFKHAKDGDLEEAEYRLNYFDAEPRWYQAALLLFAWLAADSKTARKEAKSLVARVEQQIEQSKALDLLLKWVKAGLDGVDGVPDKLPRLDHQTTEGEAVNLVLHIADTSSKNLSYLSEMDIHEIDAKWEMNNPEFFADPDALVGRDNLEELTAYLGYDHGPRLVAYARTNRLRGEELLRQYISAHAANGYVYYRNRSLWGLMLPVLSFPDPVFVKDQVSNILTAALSGSPVDFREGLVTALMGLVGAPDPWTALNERETQWRKEAMELPAVREWGDAWGSHTRRFAALAETIFSLFPGHAGTEPLDLVKHAFSMPRGFAGFRTPALISLAESMMICGAPETLIDEVLDAAEESGCNITDPVFCMRTTARVQAIRSIIKASRRENYDPYPEITAFLKNPLGQPGAAVHRVGNKYDLRDKSPKTLPLPNLCRDASSFDHLKLIYQRPYREFLRMNPDIPAKKPIIDGKYVLVPDPEFVPTLAAFYSAMAMSHPMLTSTDRRTLIQQLLPLAMPNPTALDTVMARLILVAKPQDAKTVGQMFDYLREKIGAEQP